MRTGIVLVASVCLGLFGQPAAASIQTWTFTGTLNGNLLQAEPILVDGVPGTTANLTAAGVVPNTSFAATVTFDTATPELLTFLGQPDPQFGVYPTGGFNWTIGSLVARTTHSSQAMSYLLDVNIAPPPDPPAFVDVIALTGGDPPSWNGGPLQVLTETSDPNDPGALGSAPSIALAMVQNTLSSNAQLTNPPFFLFVLNRGFSIPLLDTDTGQKIQLSGSLSNVSGGGTIPACGAGDTDGDTICDDVDLCVDDYDITQADTDGNGIANACNDAFDTDGDDWEDEFDHCPDEYNVRNKCGSNVPVLGTGATFVLVSLLGLLGAAWAGARRRS